MLGKSLAEEMKVVRNDNLWSFDKMRAYFLYIKTIDPELEEDAIEVLSKYYQLQRQCEDPNMARTTVRMLQSCIRY